MSITEPYQPVDYLVIGHITKDLTSSGYRLGGTVMYAALTAQALGLRVGLLTSCDPELDLSILDGIAIHRLEAAGTTTFENIYTSGRRNQKLIQRANLLSPDQLPAAWRNSPIVHLAPIAREVSPAFSTTFHKAMIALTPQGWLRDWDLQGRVSFRLWSEAHQLIETSSVTILSIEDVDGDEHQIDRLSQETNLLVVTEGVQGCRVYWNGDIRRFKPSPEKEIDPTGAGDIFATAFISRLKATRDPWESARFANHIASKSVTRTGLLGIPTPEEIRAAMIQIMN